MFNLNTGKGETRFSHKLDSLFWWIIRLLPLVFIVLMVWGMYRNGDSELLSNGSHYQSFRYAFRNFAYGWEQSPIYIALKTVFCGVNAPLPITNSVDSDLLLYFTYLINVELIHIMVDFLLFIPKLCHKWMSVWTQRD